MVTQDNSAEPAHAAADPSTVEMFQTTWNIYRKMVENNFLYHREAYASLNDLLVTEVARPFRFLDIACGDASSSAGALQGTTISHYRGIDFSALALESAEKSLASLECQVTLEQGDFLDAVPGRADLADIAWIGLSLHHLKSEEKLDFMREVRRILPDDGMLLIYENTTRDGEDRDGWMRRFDLQKPLWTAYTETEWQAMAAHVHAADFPESDAMWQWLGEQAGFRSTREIFASPPDLFRLYCFNA